MDRGGAAKISAFLSAACGCIQGALKITFCAAQLRGKIMKNFVKWFENVF